MGERRHTVYRCSIGTISIFQFRLFLSPGSGGSTALGDTEGGATEGVPVCGVDTVFVTSEKFFLRKISYHYQSSKIIFVS